MGEWHWGLFCVVCVRGRGRGILSVLLIWFAGSFCTLQLVRPWFGSFQLTAPPVNTKALSLLTSVAGDALTRHLSKILPALLSSLSSKRGTSEEEQVIVNGDLSFVSEETWVKSWKQGRNPHCEETLLHYYLYWPLLCHSLYCTTTFTDLYCTTTFTDLYCTTTFTVPQPLLHYNLYWPLLHYYLYWPLLHYNLYWPLLHYNLYWATAFTALLTTLLTFTALQPLLCHSLYCTTIFTDLYCATAFTAVLPLLHDNLYWPFLHYSLYCATAFTALLPLLILTALQHLLTFSQELEYCKKVVLSVTDDIGVRTIMEDLLSTINAATADSTAESWAAVTMLQAFCSHTAADYSEYLPLLFRGLIQLFVHTDPPLLLAAWTCLDSITKVTQLMHWGGGGTCMESGRGMVVFDVGQSWCVGGWGGSLPKGNVDQPLSMCYCFPWEMWTSHCACVLFYGKCGPVTVPVVLFSMGNVDQSLSLWCCFPWETWTRQTSLNHWDSQTTCRFSCTSKALTVTNTECCISFVFVLYSLLVILSEKRTELCTDVGYCIYLCDDKKVSDCEHDCVG